MWKVDETLLVAITLGLLAAFAFLSSALLATNWLEKLVEAIIGG